VRPEERDPLGPIVREALGQSRSDCPDAELLAAYADRTLDASADLDLKRHLASCARCRDTVLLMTRAADAEAAGGPEAAGGTRLQPRTSLLPRFAYLKWLGGAAAAGLAVALWAVVAPREGENQLRVNKAEDKRAPVVAEQRRESPAPPPAPNTESQPERRRATAKDIASDRERDDRAKLAEKPAAKRVPEAAAAPAAAPAPAAPAAQERKAEALLDRGQAPTRQVVEGFRVAQSEDSLSAASPGGVRWRIGGAGSIQRSSDGGAVWNEEPVRAPGARAMAAPAADVCWIVGDAGLVLRYQAGVWQRLKPPADAAIVAVTAVDALRATVTLADGRRLATEDGGATWR
jgi:hypothetical protein